MGTIFVFLLFHICYSRIIKFYMKKYVKNSFVVALSFVGAMIGVGLASGREVVSFFAKYGNFSLLFCVFSGVAFYVLIYLCLKINRDVKNNHKNKNRKNDVKCNKYGNDMAKCNKQMVFDKIYNVILYVCQIGICSAMFAGLFSIFRSLGLSIVVCYFLLIVAFFLSVVILKNGKNMVFSLNFVLSLVLILFCFILFFVKLFSGEFNFLVGSSFKIIAPFKSVLYAGMNVLTIYPLIREKSFYLKSKKEIVLISFLSSLFIVLILFVVCLSILLFGGTNIGSDMVMLSISKSVSSVLYFAYVVLILFSVFSTLLSTAYGSSKCLFHFKGGFVLSLTVSFLLSFVGFSNLIDFLYPVFGILFIVYIFLFVVMSGTGGEICVFSKSKKTQNHNKMCEKRY